MKQQRHLAIRDILSRTQVASQEGLRLELARHGFQVTQATLSRDVHELRLYKGPSGYAIASGPAEENDNLPDVRDVLRSFGLEVRRALNLLVLITTAGSAQPVAAGIDYEDWPEIVGTVAGDDTVLIICADEKQAKALKAQIEGYLG